LIFLASHERADAPRPPPLLGCGPPGASSASKRQGSRDEPPRRSYTGLHKSPGSISRPGVPLPFSGRSRPLAAFSTAFPSSGSASSPPSREASRPGTSPAKRIDLFRPAASFRFWRRRTPSWNSPRNARAFEPPHPLAGPSEGSPPRIPLPGRRAPRPARSPKKSQGHDQPAGVW